MDQFPLLKKASLFIDHHETVTGGETVRSDEIGDTRSATAYPVPHPRFNSTYEASSAPTRGSQGLVFYSPDYGHLRAKRAAPAVACAVAAAPRKR